MAKKRGAATRNHEAPRARRTGMPASISRRHYNRSLFERLYVADEEIVGADLAPPYCQLLDPDLDDLLERELAIEPVPALSGFVIEEEAEHAYQRQPVGAGMARARERRVSPVERPHGLLARERENPDAYWGRGSSVTLLVHLAGRRSNSEGRR